MISIVHNCYLFSSRPPFPAAFSLVLLLLSLPTVLCYLVIMCTVGQKVEHVCPLWAWLW